MYCWYDVYFSEAKTVSMNLHLSKPFIAFKYVNTCSLTKKYIQYC